MMVKSFYSVKESVWITIFLSIFVITLDTQAQGPTAPEAASFEPVDATDMVNLVTGDFTYVLPLLNIPSPEGGYPIALSYHAGIAMDQEASWVGLGWNINPGSINRSLNGYPDDWKDARFKEYFYDSGESQTYVAASLGYSAFGMGPSFGVSLSYSDDRGFGGVVNFDVGLTDAIGVGVSIGSNGLGLSVDGRYGISKSGWGLGGSVSTNGIGLNVDKTNKSGGTLRVGVNSSWSGDVSANANYSKGEKGKKNSVGITLSSQGLNIRGQIKGVGTGANLSFEKALSNEDYNFKRNGFFLPIYVPTPNGIFSASFGYQKVEFYLDKLETTVVNGPLYFRDAESTAIRWECRYSINDRIFTKHVDPDYVPTGVDWYEIYTVNDVDAFGDIYEVDFNSNTLNLRLNRNNAAFPNYDNFRVTAQGISGTMKASIYKNAALLGLKKEIKDEDHDNFDIVYHISNNSGSGFNLTPEFHFENEYSSSLLIQSASFDHTVSPNDIFDYLKSAPAAEYSRKKGGRYVESYTNAELVNATAYTTGLLKASSNIDYSDTTTFDPTGIGAFKITTVDGKTYHYALPVYNHEVVSRQYGMIPDRPGEDKAFFEKRQLKKYATHWLLTAITGPDYVDVNNNNLADEGDYGYWVYLDYGRWSNSFVWKSPYGEDDTTSSDDENIKIYTWGRKDVYYLDKIKTRTHTALFIKEHRNDGVGKHLFYKHRLDKNTDKTIEFRSQSLLRLREIILLKNDDANSILKTNISDISSMPVPNFSEVVSFYDLNYEEGGERNLQYSLQNNILDTRDFPNIADTRTKALKIIDFSGYSYNLAQGTPNTIGGVGGRLTLENLTFKGKGNVQLQPSYNFAYNQGSYFQDQQDEWGYNKFSPNWSNLKEIKMPTGGSIKIEYEPHSFISTTAESLIIDASEEDNNTITTTDPVDFSLFGINNGSQLRVTYYEITGCRDVGFADNGDPLDNPYSEYDYKFYNGLATVIQILNGGNTIKLEFNSPLEIRENRLIGYEDCPNVTDFNTSHVFINPDEVYTTGARVKSLITTDGLTQYKTEYTYDHPETNTTSGVVSYIPFINDLTEEIPYTMELPPPVPMYGHVTTKAYGNDNVLQGYMHYEFRTLPKRVNSSNVGFPNIIEFTSSGNAGTNPPDGYGVLTKNMYLTDNLASLGQLLSQSNYNSQGQLLSKTTNHYKKLEDISQGISQESFQVYKSIDYETNSDGADLWLISNTTKTSYPSVLESTTVVQGGLTSTTYFDKYDEVTGQLLETSSFSSDGVKFKTETVPAYTKYPSMGSMADDPTHKNMLVQSAMSKTYIYQVNEWKETSVGITTWKPNNSSGNEIWRKHKSYVWDGDISSEGTYVGFSGSDDGFDWNLNATSQPANWKQISEITKYDNYSFPLESKDINGNLVSTKLGDEDTKIIVSGNAGYAEMYYSGAEYLKNDNFDDNISGVGQNSTKAHTGKYSIAITSEEGFRVDITGHRAGHYKISVWASKDNYTNARVFDGSSLQPFNGEQIIAGDWVLLNHYTNWDSSNKVVYVNSASGTLYFDDFRIHPLQSSMISYVYNDSEELEATLAANNLATTYEYDEIGRLIRSYAEVVDNTNLDGGFKKSAEYIYQYSRPIEGVIQPLTTTVTYGSSGDNYQEFVAVTSGGSGNYDFKWYKGIEDSSTSFESTWAATGSTFTWNNISGCDIHYVKLVVIDLEYGHLGESIRITKNNNECNSDGSTSGGGAQN